MSAPSRPLSEATEDIARRRGVELVGYGSCLCGHGLVWHDTEGMFCRYPDDPDYRFFKRARECSCARFHEREPREGRWPRPWWERGC